MPPEGVLIQFYVFSYDPLSCYKSSYEVVDGGDWSPTLSLTDGESGLAL